MMFRHTQGRVSGGLRIDMLLAQDHMEQEYFTLPTKI